MIERYRFGLNSTAAADEEKKCSSVYIIWGQSAGDTSANWVLDGLLRSAVLDFNMRELVRGLDMWGIPSADVDGQEAGRYGRRLVPGEFENAWTDPPARNAMVRRGRLRSRYRGLPKPPTYEIKDYHKISLAILHAIV